MLIENAITSLERLFLVTPDVARELIQPVGDRIVFLQSVRAQKKIFDRTEEIILTEVRLIIKNALSNYNDGDYIFAGSTRGSIIYIYCLRYCLFCLLGKF